MFLLLRVLFIVPEGDQSPLRAEASGRVLRVGPCCGKDRGFLQWYVPLAAYDDFAKRFPRRTPAEIEALDIR